MSDDHMERTEEQKIAIAARKEFLAREASEKEQKKRENAKRRVIDPAATLKMLLEKKLVSKEWAARNGQSARWVTTACIANMVDAVSMTGHTFNPNPVTGYKAIR